MIKAALGMPSLSQSRVDKDSYSMWYGQKPLSTTTFHDLMIEQCGNITVGSVPMWAVMCQDGHNQEDSIYVNKASLDRGLFMMTHKRTISCEARQKGTDEETIMCPPENCVGRNARANYGKLQREGKYKGIVLPGTKVKDGDILIGKVARIPDPKEFGGQDGDIIYQDRSVMMKKIGEGTVDKIQFDKRDGQKIVWMTLRMVRRPEVGDKFASFAAQSKFFFFSVFVHFYSVFF